eukprot:m.24618 g.24618  ORF g.24618 m.24618 type:complete len:192 (+) comp13413_c0_seq2:139-714(+)
MLFDDLVCVIDQKLSPEDAALCLKSLLSFARNVEKDPTEPKYRKINLSNDKFVARVWRHEVARNFLLASGWHEENGFLVLPSGQVMTEALVSLNRRLAPTSSPSPATSVPSSALSAQEEKKRQALKAEREKLKAKMQRDKEERARVKAQIEADRKNKAAQGVEASKARDIKFGGNINRFEDIGVDLNRGGG